jgi:hypothetical protein
MVTNDNDSWWIGCEQNYTSLWQGLDLSQHLILIYMGHAKHNEFHMDRFIHPPYAVRTKNNLDHFLKKKKGGKLKFHLIRERKNNACVLCRVIDDLTREVIRTVKSPLTRLGPVWYSFMSSFTTSIAKQLTLCPTLWSASLKTHSHRVKHMVKLQKHNSLPRLWSCSWSCF